MEKQLSFYLDTHENENNHTTIHRCTVDYFFQGGNGKYKLANKSEKTI